MERREECGGEDGGGLGERGDEALLTEHGPSTLQTSEQ